MKRCPTSLDLERAFWSSDGAIRRHAEGCARCGREWAEVGALAAAARRIPVPPPSEERREAMRARLLAGSAATPAARRSLWSILSPVAAAAAVGLAWWAWPEPAAVPPPAAPIAVARIFAHEGARYVLAGEAPDEIVRLESGTLTVESPALPPGHQLRIITGDAEVEAAAAAIDVTAVADRLQAVRVLRGAVVVAVQGAGMDKTVVTTGRTWARPAEPVLDAGVSAAAPVAPPVARRAPDAAPVPRPRPRPLSPPAVVVPPPPPAPPPVAVDAGPRRSAAQQAFDDGWAALRAGDFDGAASAFDRAMWANDPGIVEDALYWRAVALARAGHALRAMRAFTSFLDAYPRSAHAGEATVMLGWLLHEAADDAGAARRFRAAIDHPSPRVRASAARGLEATGEALREP